MKSEDIFNNHIYINPCSYINQHHLDIIIEEGENDSYSSYYQVSKSADSINFNEYGVGHQTLNKSETEINKHKNDVIKNHFLKTPNKSGCTLIDIDFEGILKLIGGCNRWQILIFLIISLHQIPRAMFNLGVIYMMYQPDHWCKIGNFTKESVDNHMFLINTIWDWSTILESGLLYPIIDNENYPKVYKHDQCNFYSRNNDEIFEIFKDINFYNINNTIYSKDLVNSSVIKKCKSWEYDTSVMKETVVTKFNRVCDNNWSRAHVHLSYSIGYLIGCLLGGFISDKYGRKTTLLTFTFLATFFALLLPSTIDFESFLIIRLLLAICNEASNLAAYILCMEVTGVKYRAIVGCLLQIPWALGYILLTFMAYISRSWIFIQYFTTLLSAISILFIYFIPESPRWLMVIGKVYNAELIIRKASKINKKSLPSDLELVTHKGKNPLISKNKKLNFLKLLMLSNMAWKNGIVFFIWSSAALVYYGLVIVISDQSKPDRLIFSGNFFLNNTIAGIIELPTLGICLFLMRYGRRKAEMIMFISTGISLIMSMIFIIMEDPKTSFTFLMLSKMFIQGAFNILYIFTAEIYPTIYRNSAVGVSSMIGRVGSALSGYVAVSFDFTVPYIPMSIFAFLSLIAGAMVMFLPETKDVPLPETIWVSITFVVKKN
uniref:MFS domain-containing protein n=1 Tax=Strongyloides papillosus TaxID=174720 RepID=A0A0N5BH46_STREA